MNAGAFIIIFYLVLAIGILSNGIKQKQAQEAQKRESESAQNKKTEPVRTEPKETKTPSVKPERLRPTVSVTPHDHSDLFAGSLHAETGEGEDPHDHGFSPVSVPSMTSDIMLNASFLEEEEEQQAEGKSFFSLEGESLVRAFVMQEVLKRPDERESA